VELEGEGLVGGRVGQKVSVTLHVTDDNGTPCSLNLQKLELILHGGDKPTSAQISEQSKGEYIGTFSASREGDYILEVKYEKKSLVKQPNIKFSNATNASKSVVVSIPLGQIPANKKHKFRIESRDSRAQSVFCGGDEWEATASGPERVDHLIITDNNDGSYTTEFILPKPGEYTVDVKLNGVAASKSPIVFNAI